MNIFYDIQEIYWREPLFLLLAMQPLVIFLLKQIVRKNYHALFAEKKLQQWVILNKSTTVKNQLLSKNTLYIFAWILFALALAGPRIPIQQADKSPILGANIMFVVDLSPSMQATDITPNRLRRAKIEIFEFLHSAQQHRIGITVFSARPHLYVPLTSDYRILKTYLNSLDDLTLPTLGSDPIAAILLAKKELLQAKGKSAIILITDGDFSEIKNMSGFSQLDQLIKEDIPLYILGMGTVEGEAVPLKDGTWLKHEQQAVVSQMNEKHLQQLANRLNGKYSPVYDDASDWDILYQQGLLQHKDAVKINSKHRILWQELFPYFLFPALILFFFSLSRFRLIKTKSIASIFFILLLTTLPDKNVLATDVFSLDSSSITLWPSDDRAAYNAYKNKRYKKAETLYKSLTGYRSYLGQGNSLYKRGHYQDAIQQFTFAIVNAKNNEQRVTALYNLANCYFRTGRFTTAITTYEDVLRYQPNHKASIANLQTSKVLQKTLEQRIKDNAWVTAIQQGRGPRSASVMEGTDINENTSVSLDGTESKPKSPIPLPDLPDINEDDLIKLLALGLQNIQLAKNNGQPTSSLQQSTQQEENSTISIIRAQQKTNAITDSQALLWKRIFEIEEGFPAPVKKPHHLPKVKPW